MNELSWIKLARQSIGLREVKGIKHNPIILSWLKSLKAWWANDEVAWCGTFVAQALAASGRSIPKHWYRAIDYLNYGTVLERPAYGCIVAFRREGGGHVGFVVGRDKYGNLMVLGGNQGDAVNIKPFSIGRVAGYRWPSDGRGVAMSPNPERYNLPVLDSDGRISSDES